MHTCFGNRIHAFCPGLIDEANALFNGHVHDIYRTFGYFGQIQAFLHGFGFTHPRSGSIPGCRFPAFFQKFILDLKENLRILTVNPHEGLAAFFGQATHFFESQVNDAVIDAADTAFPDRLTALVRKQQLDTEYSIVAQAADLFYILPRVNTRTQGQVNECIGFINPDKFPGFLQDVICRG